MNLHLIRESLCPLVEEVLKNPHPNAAGKQYRCAIGRMEVCAENVRDDSVFLDGFPLSEDIGLELPVPIMEHIREKLQDEWDIEKGRIYNVVYIDGKVIDYFIFVPRKVDEVTTTTDHLLVKYRIDEGLSIMYTK